MKTEISAFRCEKIPEAEFDKNPEVEENWKVAGRKNGFVYLIYDNFKKWEGNNA